MRDAVRFAAERARLAIVSGAAREEIVPVVAAAGLGELFATVVADDDVARGKPDPESYLLALDALGTAAPARRSSSRTPRPASRPRRPPGTRVVGVARDAGARAARAGRRDRGHDRRAVAPAPARMTLDDRSPGSVCGTAREHAGGVRACDRARRRLRRVRRPCRGRRRARRLPRPAGGRRADASRRWSTQCAGRIGLMCELKTPVALPAPRRRRACGRAAARGRRRRLLRAAGAARRCEGLRTLQHVGLGVSIRRAARSRGASASGTRARGRAGSRSHSGSASGRPSTRSTTPARMRELVALGVTGSSPTVRI